jgi:hypothetical protein
VQYGAKAAIRGQCFKTFITVVYEFSQKARVFVSGKFIRPSLMFTGNAKTYPNEVPFKCFTVGLAPDHTHKHYIRL